MKGICSHCGKSLSSYNRGKLCYSCQEKVRNKIASEEKRSHYTVEDMRCLLGLESQESVRRWARKGLIPGRVPLRKQHLFTKETIDNWLKSDTVPNLSDNWIQVWLLYHTGWNNDQISKALRMTAAETASAIARGEQMVSDIGKLSFQLVLLNERDTPVICPVSNISQTNEIKTVLGDKQLYIIKGVALIDNKNIPIIFDWDKGYWRKLET